MIVVIDLGKKSQAALKEILRKTAPKSKRIKKEIIQDCILQCARLDSTVVIPESIFNEETMVITYKRNR